MSLRLKMYSWRDWNEWAQVYHLLFISNDIGMIKSNIYSDGEREVDLLLKNESNLKIALNTLCIWLIKNVGGDQ